MGTASGVPPARPAWRGYGRATHLDDDAPSGRQGRRTQAAAILSAWYETRRATGLQEHLERYGPAPDLQSGQLIAAVEAAGLTGRGGAAFPTARKLQAVAGRAGPAVVVANGMESEPASLKDETLLDLAPNLVIDGMVLAAREVGAERAHLCLPRTRSRQTRQLRDIVVERWSRRIDDIEVFVHELPHHYVSSEETSLVRWLNDGQARPSSVPPRPFERGVEGHPTLVDNVETLAHLALIARYGPQWFRSHGTADAPGTTLVTLSGALSSPGVYEVELGASLGDLLSLGSPTAAAQAVLLGGFFGAWLPADRAAALPYSAPAIASAGGGIGAGVIAVLPEGVCGLSETARVLDYLAGQSARQCGPCRFGLPATARDFADLAWGRIDSQGWQRLQEHVALLRGRGACKHPDGASRLAASALDVFAADARHHLAQGPCPAAHASAGMLPVPHTEAIEDDDWQ